MVTKVDEELVELLEKDPIFKQQLGIYPSIKNNATFSFQRLLLLFTIRVVVLWMVLLESYQITDDTTSLLLISYGFITIVLLGVYLLILFLIWVVPFIISCLVQFILEQ